MHLGNKGKEAVRWDLGTERRDLHAQRRSQIKPLSKSSSGLEKTNSIEAILDSSHTFTSPALVKPFHKYGGKFD
ncbi:hypothetical protein Pyn_39742 [Prunus yedoensis var. nudiflora]|uniref:Uncharacterized protein n=1 Tax=Prunus yedoensis var. nudiflora TaxID=2094558 RepID=A0A314Y3N1_PRUYE|nr:hypothetical protein Pyn_39742 [Prunus yedoensis var. nudiflora]